MPHLLVAIGGALGAVARYQLTLVIRQTAPEQWPAATFTANGLGSLGIGIVFVLLERSVWSEDYRYLLMAGFFGAFTTFSTFSLELVHQLERGAWLAAVTYASVSVITCLIGVTVGIWGMRLLL